MMKLRTYKDGMIKPDCFTNGRISFQLPGVGSLLVLFSRNHNFIARKLAEINENSRFNPTKYSPEYLDEKLFQMARLINGGCYYNLIIHDYIRTVLGVRNDSPFILDPRMQPPPHNPSYGNQSSLEFNYVYRWHMTIGESDAELLEHLGQLRADMGKFAIEDGLPISNSRGAWMARGDDGSFDDSELAFEIKRGMKQVAGFPGAQHIPAALQPFEEKAILQGRTPELRLPSLNEYRAHFNLKTYRTFEEVNDDPKVANALRNLYGNVDDVELYPGMIAEQTRDRAHGGISEGTAFGYTISAGILQDAVNLIRNDRFLTTDLTPERYTKFGYNLITNPPSAGVPAHNGSIMAHLLSLLNGQFHPNEQCVKDPYHTAI